MLGAGAAAAMLVTAAVLGESARFGLGGKRRRDEWDGVTEAEDRRDEEAKKRRDKKEVATEAKDQRREARKERRQLKEAEKQLRAEFQRVGHFPFGLKYGWREADRIRDELKEAETADRRKLMKSMESAVVKEEKQAEERRKALKKWAEERNTENMAAIMQGADGHWHVGAIGDATSSALALEGGNTADAVGAPEYPPPPILRPTPLRPDQPDEAVVVGEAPAGSRVPTPSTIRGPQLLHPSPT